MGKGWTLEQRARQAALICRWTPLLESERAKLSGTDGQRHFASHAVIDADSVESRLILPLEEPHTTGCSSPRRLIRSNGHALNESSGRRSGRRGRGRLRGLALNLLLRGRIAELQFELQILIEPGSVWAAAQCNLEGTSFLAAELDGLHARGCTAHPPRLHALDPKASSSINKLPQQHRFVEHGHRRRPVGPAAHFGNISACWHRIHSECRASGASIQGQQSGGACDSHCNETANRHWDSLFELSPGARKYRWLRCVARRVSRD